MGKEVMLPSGRVLDIQVAPFAVSKALYLAMVEELKSIKLASGTAISDAAFWKDLLCTMHSSPKMEACLNECMKRVTYNGVSIKADTFEPVENREDYPQVCMEVATENVGPFMKSLFAQFCQLLASAHLQSQALRSEKTT